MQSARDFPLYFTKRFDPTPYDRIWQFEGDLSGLAKSIRQHAADRPIAGIVSGIDTGVAVADSLGRTLGLPGNDPATSALRRDKWLMAEALARARIRHVKQRRVASAAEALQWVSANCKWPVVAKPVDSAGTQGFAICENEHHLLQHVNALLRQRTVFETPISSVLVQELLVGTEYIVNTVTAAGLHRPVDAWRCRKMRSGQSKVYDLEELVPITDPTLQSQVLPYLFLVLTALGVEEGPAHTELMLSDSGTVLIETGARLQGSIDPSAVDLCIGSDHATAAARAIAIRHLNVQEHDASRLPELKRYCYCVGMVSHYSGVLREFSRESEIRSLRTFYSMSANYRTGDFMPVTSTLLDSPGAIYLVSSDRYALEADYRTLRQWEKVGLFSLEAVAAAGSGT